MTRSRGTSASSLVAAVLTGLAGFIAFNVVDTVFGVPLAIAGLAVWIAVTVLVYRRSPPAGEDPDA